MFSLAKSLVFVTFVALCLPATVSAQILPPLPPVPPPFPPPPPIPPIPAFPGLGLGAGLTQQQQLGPPPAGVLLHQQYMQLYGLPTSFLNSGTNNGGRAGAFPGYGGGYPGYGAPGYYGVNYQRNLAAWQAYYRTSGYATNPTFTGSFGMSISSPQQPSFSQSALTSNPSPSFSGFGLSNTANPFSTSTSKKDENKDEKKDGKKEDK